MIKTNPILSISKYNSSVPSWQLTGSKWTTHAYFHLCYVKKQTRMRRPVRNQLGVNLKQIRYNVAIDINMF